VPKVQETMVSERVLDVAMYPTIVFRSREIVVARRIEGQLRLRVGGTLTLHGVTRLIAGPVDVTLAADQLIGTGTLIIKQTDFGIEPVSAGLGTVKVKNEVAVSYTFTAQR
jgi:polyisoprenoid-binding protein YceI